MNTHVHPSSWSNRRQRDHAAEVDREPWQTHDRDLELRIGAAVIAVAEAMPHLTVAAILFPPHAWFDAALARQIVVFILVNRLEVPRRVVSAVSLICREAVSRACRTVEARCQDKTFSKFVSRVGDRADALYRLKRIEHDA